MVQDLASGDIRETCGSVAKGSKVHGLDGADELLLQCFVGGIVFSEKMLQGLVLLIDCCDLIAGRARGMDRNGAGIGRCNERDCRESGVDGWGDG